MSQELKNKLFHFEATPPAGTWDAISNALEEHSLFNAERLSNYSEVPASHNWDKITTGLTAAAQPISTPDRPLNRPLKMMIAAAVLGLVAFGIIQVLNSRPITSKQAMVTAQKETPPVSATAAPAMQQAEEKTSIPDAHNTTSGQTQQAAAETSRATTEIRPRLSRYVTINNDEGQTVRLSKKAYTLMACAENSTAVNYKNCKENIQMMQQKMSASLISPSGDFSGLVDMVKSLEAQN